MQPTGADIATIEMLYRQHSPALVLFAVALTGERSRAQDAVQQVFLKLLERGSLGRPVDVKAYLFACVRNAILNDAKVRQRDVPLNQESTWFDAPKRDYAAELNLRRALGALSDDQRQVTVLHIWGELTFSQIADVLV
jgi:RNA polymerase sigma factor (sigma-70 family)